MNYVKGIFKAWFGIHLITLFFAIPITLAIKTLQWSGWL